MRLGAVHLPLDRGEANAAAHHSSQGIDSCVRELVADRLAVTGRVPAVLCGTFAIASGQLPLLRGQSTLPDDSDVIANLRCGVTALGHAISPLCGRVSSRR